MVLFKKKKIHFAASEIPQNPGQFAIYAFDEESSLQSGYVDIRGNVQARTNQWLNQLSKFHGILSRRFLRHTFFWWWLPQSRLDARPWGQEEYIKPLFFAMSVVQWLKENPQKTLTVIGAPKFARIFIEELAFNKSAKMAPAFGLLLFRQIVIFIGKSLQQMLVLAAALFNRSPYAEKAKTLVFFERFDPRQTITEARDYYFKRLFDCVEHKMACLDQISSKYALGEAAINIIARADPWDIWRAFARNLSLGFLILWIGLLAPVCNIGGFSSKSFWRFFLWAQFARCSIFRQSIIFDVFRRFAKEGTLTTVVYPYEEKGYERALLLALKSSRVKTIGYTPHPQHELAVSMQDKGACRPPRPTMYAVCGAAYVGYFQHWGRKKNTIHVWGSAKARQQDFRDIHDVDHLNILILLSHPHELDVFYSWLKAEPGLTKKIQYLIRGYQSVPSGVFASRLATLRRDYPQAKAVSGELSANLSEADLAIFNATSAGLLAVNAGKLVVHACLDDFFKINCCFNNLGPMLSCATAKELAHRLLDIRMAGRDRRQYLWRQQVKAAAAIFDRVNHKEIQKDIS